MYKASMFSYAGGYPEMPVPSALPPHLQKSMYMEPKMTSTPEGAAVNGWQTTF